MKESIILLSSFLFLGFNALRAADSSGSQAKLAFAKQEMRELREELYKSYMSHEMFAQMKETMEKGEFDIHINQLIDELLQIRIKQDIKNISFGKSCVPENAQKLFSIVNRDNGDLEGENVYKFKADIDKAIDEGQDINASNKHGLTLLMYAAATGRFLSADYLLEKSANPELTDILGRTYKDYLDIYENKKLIDEITFDNTQAIVLEYLTNKGRAQEVQDILKPNGLKDWLTAKGIKIKPTKKNKGKYRKKQLLVQPYLNTLQFAK